MTKAPGLRSTLIGLAAAGIALLGSSADAQTIRFQPVNVVDTDGGTFQVQVFVDIPAGTNVRRVDGFIDIDTGANGLTFNSATALNAAFASADAQAVSGPLGGDPSGTDVRFRAITACGAEQTNGSFLLTTLTFNRNNGSNPGPYTLTWVNGTTAYPSLAGACPTNPFDPGITPFAGSTFQNGTAVYCGGTYVVSDLNVDGNGNNVTLERIAAREGAVGDGPGNPISAFTAFDRTFTVNAIAATCPVSVTATTNPVDFTGAMLANISVAGSNPATVEFDVRSNPGPARVGVISVNQQPSATYTIFQEDGCRWTLPRQSQVYSSDLQRDNFAMFPTNILCGYTLRIDPPEAEYNDQGTADPSDDTGWVTIEEPTGIGFPSGTGNISLQILLQKNFNPTNRSARIRVEGVTYDLDWFDITQNGTCRYEAEPVQSALLPAGASAANTFDVNLTPPQEGLPSCSWTVDEDSTSPWITNVAVAVDGLTGYEVLDNLGNPTGIYVGYGVVSYDTTANTGEQRQGIITLATETGPVYHYVNQADGCALAFSTTATNLSASASGTFTANFSVNAGSADCAWTILGGADWFDFTPRSGFGTTPIDLTAFPNTGAARSTTLTLVGAAGVSTIEVVQDAGCTITAIADPASFASAAQTSSFDIAGLFAECEWTVSEDSPWLAITGATTGFGNATVNYALQPNDTGATRSTVVTVTGPLNTVAFTVTQNGTCGLPGNAAFNVSAVAGVATLNFALDAFCDWTITEDNRGGDWVRITDPTSGTGNIAVDFAYESNPGAPRSKSWTVSTAVNSVIVTINQDSDCALTLSTASATVGADAGTTTFDINLNQTFCDWTISGGSDWAYVDGPLTGAGSTTVTVAFEANTGIERETVFTVTGPLGTQTFTLTQNDDCTLALSAVGTTLTSTDTAGSFGITGLTAACPWTVSEDSDWLDITSAAAGIADATVIFSTTTNPGFDRVAVIQVVGSLNTETYTVTQLAGCTALALSSTADTVGAAAGTISFDIEGLDTFCPWTVTEGADWLEVAGITSGFGNATISLNYDFNPGDQRSATIVVTGSTASTTYVLTQTAGCQLTLSSNSANDPSGNAGSLSFDIQNLLAGCDWRVEVASAPWIQVDQLAGEGPATVRVNWDANPGETRTALINVIGELNTETFTLTQGEACNFTLSSTSANDPSGLAGTTTFDIQGLSAHCPWSISDDAEWADVFPTSGFGPATVTINWTANPGADRAATFTVDGNLNAETFTLTQGESCNFTLSSTSANDPTGLAGTTTFNIEGLGAHCPWSISDDAEWADVFPTSGFGPATVTINWTANPGFAREATFTVSGNLNAATFTLSQGDACALEATPGTASVGQVGGFVTFEITALGGAPLAQHCAWSISTEDNDWLDIAPLSGFGPATITVNYDNNSGSERVANITVTGNINSSLFTITQSAGCQFEITDGTDPFDSATVGPDAGSVEVCVEDIAAFCAWTAITEDTDWIDISPTAGIGQGCVTINYEANPGIQRTATITFATESTVRVYTLTQEPGCALTLSSNSATDATGLAGTITINVETLSAHCPWTITNIGADWIDVFPLSGTGPGSFTINWEANPGAERVATFSVNGNLNTETFTLTQGPSCALALSSNSATGDSLAGSATINVTGLGAHCPWTAVVEDADWVDIAPATGLGPGAFTINWEANPGIQRVARITVTGNLNTQVFTLTQQAGCTLALNPANATGGGEAGSTTFQITGLAAHCAWSIATEDTEWVDISPLSGFGPATITVRWDNNFGAQRQATISVTGNLNTSVFTLTQNPGCAFTLSPTSFSAPSQATNGTFQITGLSAYCTWEVNEDTPWVEVTSARTGAGPATVSFRVEQNTGVARSATVTVTGTLETRTFTINQTGVACVPVVTPPSAFFDQNGGNGAFTVTFSVPNATADCRWIAVSNVDWIDVFEGAQGTGNGLVTYVVDRLPADSWPPAARTGTITVTVVNSDGSFGASATHTVDQEDLCLIVGLSPSSLSFDNRGFRADGSGNSGRFTVLFPAGIDGCEWRAQANVNWIRIIEGSTGVGTGDVSYEVDPNVVPGPDESRTGTITVTTRTGRTAIHTVFQDQNYYDLSELQLGLDDMLSGFSDIANIDYTSELPEGNVTRLETVDPRNGIRTVVELFGLAADANGRVITGFATVSTFDSAGNPVQSLSGIPVQGSLRFRRDLTNLFAPGSYMDDRGEYTYGLNRSYNIKVGGGFEFKGQARNGEGRLFAFRLQGRLDYNQTFYANEPEPQPTRGGKGGEENLLPPYRTLLQTSVQALAAGRANGFADNLVMDDFRPAITKSSFVLQPSQLKLWTGDLLLLNSEFVPSQESRGGLSRTEFRPYYTNIRPTPYRFGRFDFRGRVGRYNFASTGASTIPFEELANEGFTLDELRSDLDNGEIDPSPRRTAFPASASMTSPAIILTERSSYDRALYIASIDAVDVIP
ncbi:MAG: BACON domain-containing carbohydrate-binding protein [Candidatus Sumerlaeia bacterium]|nr:BACON domain-containing carbohydrate-binding protein [Candidatus Sumerlaeia bacterium]